MLDAEPDLETVAEAADAERAVFEAIEHRPDVVLMDVRCRARAGSRASRRSCRRFPSAKVLMLSMQDDPRYVREAFAAGASGYVLKEAADTDVVGAIRAVAAGERYVHPTLGARLIEAEAEERRRAEADPLSDREREVLRLLALGHTNQEIAKLLFISVRTAETHRAHIMQKLGLASRAELVRYALAEGLLEALTQGIGPPLCSSEAPSRPERPPWPAPADDEHGPLGFVSTPCETLPSRAVATARRPRDPTTIDGVDGICVCDDLVDRVSRQERGPQVASLRGEPRCLLERGAVDRPTGCGWAASMPNPTIGTMSIAGATLTTTASAFRSLARSSRTRPPHRADEDPSVAIRISFMCRPSVSLVRLDVASRGNSHPAGRRSARGELVDRPARASYVAQLPGLRAARAGRRTRTRASTATQRREERARGSGRARRPRAGRRRDARGEEEVGERTRVRGRDAAEAGDEPARLAARHELVRVVSVSGAIRNAASPISSAKTPPGPNATSGPNTGSCTTPGEQLRTALDHRLHEHRAADPLGRRRTAASSAQVERDSAELGLVGAGTALLTTTGKPSSAAAAAASSGVAATRSGTSGMP